MFENFHERTTTSMRKKLRNFLLPILRWFGSDIIDSRTGKKAGRAFLFAWGGKIHVIGLESVVEVHFLPQKRLTYWKQEIGFRTPAPPDFPHVTPENAARPKPPA